MDGIHQITYQLLNELSIKKEIALIDLFTQLGYDYQREDGQIIIQKLARSQSEVVDKIEFFAGCGDFKIFWIRLKPSELRRTDERIILNQINQKYPYNLTIFSNSDDTHWDFVNVKLIADKTEENQKSEKRKYIRRIRIGETERLHTASERISKLQILDQKVSPLALQNQHDDAFDVEQVTQRFFDEFVDIFRNIKVDLYKQTKDKAFAHKFTIQFLSRIMFFYFIQKKRWLGDDVEFFKHYWDTYRKSGRPIDSFVSDWLRILFFESLNHKYSHPAWMPQELHAILHMAPFLNGGLFTQNPKDDAFNDYKCLITDAQFENILNFFQSYNFTITEDSPIDQEVAVDPEMIGKVYESLVNVSDEIDERGEAGVFYTPRTEIRLMCSLALVDRMTKEIGEEHRNLLYELIFAFSEDEKNSVDERVAHHNLWGKIDQFLRTVTILDPAVGSGSFLVGMLSIITDLSKRANNQIGTHEREYDLKKRIIANSLYGVDVMEWAVSVCELRLWLQLVVETDLKVEERTLEALLPNLTFKIRQGDSLVQQIGDLNLTQLKTSNLPSYIKGRITSLKSEKLKYFFNDKTGKFRTKESIHREEVNIFDAIIDHQADKIRKEIHRINQIIEQPDFEQLSLLTNEQGDKKEQLNFLREQYLQAKQAQQTELEKLHAMREKLTNPMNVPFVWDIAFVEIFEGDQQGFDIVLGNPPYVRQELIADPKENRENFSEDAWRERKRAYKNKLMQSVYEKFPDYFKSKRNDKILKPLNAKNDLYVYFYLHGLSLLNSQGSFCFVTSNSWLDVGYGRDLQEFLIKNVPIHFIMDNQVKRTFKSADVNTVICLFGNPQEKVVNDQRVKFIMFKTPYEYVLEPVIFEEIESAGEMKTTPEYRIIVKTPLELLQNGSEIVGRTESVENVQTQAKEPNGFDDLCSTNKVSEPVSRTDSVGKSQTKPKNIKDFSNLCSTNNYTGDKWGGKYLRAPDIYYKILEKGKGKLVRLGDIAEVRFGIKTGANEFFYLDKDKIAEWGIEEEFLKPVIFSLKELKCIADPLVNLTLKMISCHKDKKELKNSKVLAYIEWGEKEKFSIRPSVHGRNPWYSLGKHWKAVPLVFPAKVGERFLVLLNTQQVFEDKKLYGIIPKSNDSVLELAAILNSTLTRFFVDLTCRQLTGAQAIADIDVMVAENLQIVNPSFIDSKILLERFWMLAKDTIGSILLDCGFDKDKSIRSQHPNPLPDRKALDDIVFDALSLTQDERNEVYWAVCELVQNRLSKARSV